MFNKIKKEFRSSIASSETSSNPEIKIDKPHSSASLQYDAIIDLELFRSNAELWFVKATIMHAIASIMVEKGVRTSDFDPEDILKAVIDSFEDRRGSQGHSKDLRIPFQESKLFRELRKPHTLVNAIDYQTTEKNVLGRVRGIYEQQFAGGRPELEDTSPPSSQQDRHSAPYSHVIPPSIGSTAFTDPSLSNTSLPGHAPRSAAQYQTPSPTPQPRQTMALPIRDVRSPANSQTQESISQSYGTRGSSPAPNEDYPMCPARGCTLQCILFAPTDKPGPNHGRRYFKCPKCVKDGWKAFSGGGLGGAPENICYCRLVGRPEMGKDPGGRSSTWMYVCSRNVCDFKYYP